MFLKIVQLCKKDEYPSVIAELGFVNSIRFAKTLMCQEDYNLLAEYAAGLLLSLRAKYPDFCSHWKYHAYLGYIYDFGCDYPKSFWEYHKAFQNHKPASPVVLFGLASSIQVYDSSPLYESASLYPPCPMRLEDAIGFAKLAIKEKMYVELAVLLRALYRELGNLEEVTFWNQVMQQLDEHPRIPLPDWGELFGLTPFTISD